MNSSKVDTILNEYYSTFMERNDMAQVVVTPQYVEDHRQEMEDMVRLFTLYPDYLVDVITPGDSYFKLFFYQRIFLRVCMRFKEVSGTFPRAYSKSFLDFLAMNVRGIMQPGSKGFTCADTKKQAAQIVEEKTNENAPYQEADFAQAFTKMISSEYLSSIRPCLNSLSESEAVR